jgi:hypothetical protein
MYLNLTGLIPCRTSIIVSKIISHKLLLKRV